MELTLEPQASYARLRIVGAVRLSDVAEFEVTLTSLVRPELPRILVDCTAMDQWDEGAVAAMRGFIAELEHEGHPVALFGLTAKLTESLRRLGLLELLPVHDSEAEALASIGAADA